MHRKQTKINIAPYVNFLFYLTYQDEIKNLKGYIFEKKIIIKKFWDGLPVFAQ